MFLRETDDEWKLDQSLDGHQDWVRDVAWAPNIGVPVSIIASCGEVCHLNVVIMQQLSKAYGKL